MLFFGGRGKFFGKKVFLAACYASSPWAPLTFQELFYESMYLADFVSDVFLEFSCLVISRLFFLPYILF